jgi:hypothetical protein
MDFNKNLRIGFFLLILFALINSVFSACYANGVEVECPQILNDYGWVIAVIVVVIILAVIGFFAFTFLKAFSTGKVSISLLKTVFAPNEKITGKMIVELKKVIQTSNAKVTLQGEVNRTEFRNGSRYSKIEVFFQTSETIVVQPTYPIGKTEIDFAITIPVDILKKGKFDASSLGQIGSAINFIQSVALPKPKWYLIASITNSENITLSTKQRIEIN